jgi:hypothetical protein
MDVRQMTVMYRNGYPGSFIVSYHDLHPTGPLSGGDWFWNKADLLTRVVSTGQGGDGLPPQLPARRPRYVEPRAPEPSCRPRRQVLEIMRGPSQLGLADDIPLNAVAAVFVKSVSSTLEWRFGS